MLRVGYIGLGIMGKPMARNILRAGFPLVVHNRSRGPVEELVALGAQAAASPAAVAAAVDVVITNLPDSATVEQVVLGPQGIRAGAHPGLVFVDHSTIHPETARRLAATLAEDGVEALDAPVSGGDIGAQQGTLTIMVGGSVAALERVRPVLQAEGRVITHIGPPGAGQVAKAANQIMVAAQMAAMAELLLLAQKAGADPQRVVAAIRGGAAGCWTLDHKPPRLFRGDRRPGFKARMMEKDLAIVMDTGRAYGMPLPVSGLLDQLYRAMLEMGLGDLDNSAIIAVYETLAQTKLQTYPEQGE